MGFWNKVFGDTPTEKPEEKQGEKVCAHCNAGAQKGQIKCPACGSGVFITQKSQAPRNPHTSNSKEMRISECRYWKCPDCDWPQKKGVLDEAQFADLSNAELSDFIRGLGCRCQSCGKFFEGTVIFGGRFDCELPAP